MMRRRFSDPTVIRYAFYFADEQGKQEFLDDHNSATASLGCKKLDMQGLTNHLSVLNSGVKPYTCLPCNQNCDSVLRQRIKRWVKGFSQPKEGI